MDKKNNIVTRFAPSPTGAAHAGGYRTAMYAWMYARHNNGRFILRIEDTNKEKNVPGSAEEIQQSLKWLGISFDGLYVQSKNLPRHQEVLRKLMDEGKAYVSQEEAKDGSGEMKDLIRFRNPNKKVTFTDKIRGEITFDTTELGDFIIARNINEPVYHLAVVVDDHDEGVTCVIRAEEHISNTPRHILIMEALGFEIPEFAHLPLVLTADKKKLSKRKGATAMYQYAEMGYLPDAVFNYVAMCGWNPGDSTEQEIFSKEELIKLFSLDKVHKSPAVFNEEKLNWFNREYVKKLPRETQKEMIKKFLPEKLSGISDRMLEKLVPVIVERLNYFGELAKMSNDGEFDYYLSRPEIDLMKLPGKGNEVSNAKRHLEKVFNLVKDIEEKDWNDSTVKEAVWAYAEEAGKGNVLWPMRYALSGRDKSPDPFVLAGILGREESIARINHAISYVS